MSIPRGGGRTRQLVLQATSLCNIDCTYCYLPNRRVNATMSLETVRRLVALLRREGVLAPVVDVRWHAGEPLAAPHDFYRSASGLLKAGLDDSSRLEFSIQTNATLVDDRWIGYFQDYAVRVGVSLDGPEAMHDAYRRTRSGGGTFARAMRGVRRLQCASIDFDLISVITPVTLARPREYIRFLEELRPRSVALNPEETEGVNLSSLFEIRDYAIRYREFLHLMADFQDRTGVRVSALADMAAHVTLHELPVINTQCEPMMILSVAADGRVSTFSPELLDATHDWYGDFAIADLRDPSPSLADWPQRAIALAQDISRGQEACRASCSYFAVCGGGAPSNKLAENGDVASTVTGSCRNRVMAPADVILERLELGVAGGTAAELTGVGWT